VKSVRGPESACKLGLVIGDILQPTHLIFVLVVALLVLGPKRLPEVGRALGRGLRDFRSALSQADPREELNEHKMEITQTTAPTPESTPVPTPPPTPAAAVAAPTAQPVAAPTAQPVAAPTAQPVPEPAEHKS
jgi:sec-independent protein translocase protein TatA